MSQQNDPYAAWRFASYRYFFTGRTIFFIGSHMQSTAVAWQIYELLGSKMALGYIGLVQIIPVLFFSLPAGHLADRLNRKSLIMFGQGLFLVCSIGLALVSILGASPIYIYSLLFLIAVSRICTVPAMGAMIPSIIPRQAWGNATMWNSTAFETSAMLGPAAAGGIIALSGGVSMVYCTTAVCALIGYILFLLIRLDTSPQPTKSATWKDVVGGLRFMWNTKVLLAAASLDLFAVLLGGATILLPVVAKDILHVGPEGFGLLRAAPSVGAVIMALITAHLPPWKRSGKVLFGALGGFGLATIIFGLSTNFWLSFAMLLTLGMCDNLNVVIRQTLIQFITPDAMRGRVTSVNFIFIGCSNELGALESGITAQLFGTVPSIVLGGVGTIIAVATIMKLSPQLRKLGRLDEIKPVPLSSS